MSNTNRFGLARAIPEHVKAQVRQRCGFGCVICGRIPYEYDHFRVSFSDSKEHDPEDIILLCKMHHGQKTARQIGNDWIAKAAKVAALDRPARFKLPGTNPAFRVKWPANEIDAAMQGIVIDGKRVLELRYQADELEPIVISGVFRALDGTPLCQILNNELVATPSHLGDFLCTSNRFQFRDLKRRKSLDFLLSTDGLIISDITHASGGSLIVGNRRGLWLCNGAQTLLVRDIAVQDCQIAIDVRSRWVRDYERFDITTDPNCSSIQGITLQGGYSGIGL